MIIKKLRVKSLKEAEVKVKEELGPEAEILFHHLLENNQYEVTAGVPEELLSKGKEKEQQDVGPTHKNIDLLGKELEALLEMKIMEKTKSVPSQGKILLKEDDKPTLTEFLFNRGLSLSLARSVDEKLKSLYSDIDVDQFYQKESCFHKKLVDEVSSYIKVYNPWINALSPPRIFCFLGASGVGKSSVIQKIAVLQKENHQKKVCCITLEPESNLKLGQIIVSLSQLKIPYKTVSSAQGLLEAINEYQKYDLILIDTPGISPFIPEEGEAVWNLLRKIPSFETFIVISSAREIDQIEKEYEQFDKTLDANLVYTKLDEIDKPGKMISLSHKLRRPLSFVTDKEIHSPTPTELAEFIISGNWEE